MTEDRSPRARPMLHLRAHALLFAVALLECRLVLGVLGHRLDKAEWVVRNVTDGTGHAYAFMNRLLGTLPVAWTSDVTGLSIRTAFSLWMSALLVACNAAIFEMVRRYRPARDALAASLATAFGFVLLQDRFYLNLWDVWDLMIHGATACRLVFAPSIPAFAAITVFGMWNRESAAFVGVACALSGLDLRTRTLDVRRVVVGTLLSVGVLVVTAVVRAYRFHGVARGRSNVWGSSLRGDINADWLGRVLESPGIVELASLAFLVAMVALVGALWRRTGDGGRRAFGVALLMLVVHPIFANLVEVRALIAAVPYLVIGALDRREA